MAKRVPLARRNLLHNKRRLIAALAGVGFSVILVNMQVGVLVGMLANASAFIDRLPNEIWIMPLGTTNFDQPTLLPEATLYRARSVPGVAWAEKMIVGWSTAKTSHGNNETIQVIGLPSTERFRLPWTVDPPAAADLLEPRGVIMDVAEKKRLYVERVGDEFESNHKRVKVVGFTDGMRSFTTAPYIVTRYPNAEEIQIAPATSFQYVLVKVADGADPVRVQQDLQEKLGTAEVLLAGEFRCRTYSYWLFGTGVGTAFLMAAVLGFVVGGAVVAQVLYANVVDQRPQFGVLKAMGAGNGYLCRVVMTQAFLTAVLGYVTGMALTIPLVFAIRAVGTPILVPWELAAAAFVAVVFVCLLAALLPISQLVRLEPALVFQG